MTAQEFNRLIYVLRPRLLHFAAGFFPQDGAATAEDMVQEAMLKTWESLESGKKVEKMEALCMCVLRNTCIDYLRLKKNQNLPFSNPAASRLAGAIPSANDLQQSLERKQACRQIEEFLSQMPEAQQTCFRLRDVMGYEMEDIAQVMGTTEGNVRTILSRTRKELRMRLLKQN